MLDCNTKVSNFPVMSGVDLFPDWQANIISPNGLLIRKLYAEGRVVKIVREAADGELIPDLYKSLINDNTTHPVDGSRDSPPTWVFTSIATTV